MPYSGQIKISSNLMPWANVRLPLIILMAIFGLPSAHASSLADDATVHAALANCVGRHLKPEDNGTVVGMLILVLADAEPPESGFHELLEPKRDDIMSNVAKLVTRLSEQDCRQELMAISPNTAGERFVLLFGQIMARSGSSLQMAGERVGQVFAIDLLKKLDSKVAVDLLGSAVGGSTNSSTRVTPPPAAPYALRGRGRRCRGTKHLMSPSADIGGPPSRYRLSDRFPPVNIHWPLLGRKRHAEAALFAG